MGSRFRGPLTLFRIASAAYPIFDGRGAAEQGGRWTSIGRRAIYASEHLATAMIESLVHFNIGRLPRNSRFIEIEVPADLEIERIEPEDVPGWNAPDQIASRAFGDAWHAAGRTGARPPVLLVPSVVVPRECNAVINQDHSLFGRIRAAAPEPLIWDPRLIRT